MIALAAIWIALGCAAFAIGHALLAAAMSPRPERYGDRLLLAAWLGLIGIEWLAFAISLILPVTPLTLFPLVGVVALALLFTRRGDIARELRPLLRTDVVLAAAISVAAAGYAAAGLWSTPDTGGYHYPAIRWLAEQGTVVGVANILIRLGYVSSLSAVVAAADAIMPGRALPAVNGFILLLLVAQIALVATRVGRGAARPSDWFAGAAASAIVALGLIVGTVTTASPDLSIMALTVVACWSLLIHAEAPSPRRAFVPLLLTCGALNVKLSGLLLAPVGWLFAVAGRPFRIWIAATAVAALIVAPFFIAAIMTSGCFAMPVRISCLPVPWAVPHETVRLLATNLWEWSRWASPRPDGAGDWDWLAGWLIGHNQWLNATVFWFFVASLAGYLFVAGKSFSKGERWVLALIVPSIALVFFNAPDLRFNFGLFVTPAALLVMRVAHSRGVLRASRAGAALARPAVASGIVAVVLVICAIALDLRHNMPLTAERLLLPRAAPSVAVTQHNAGALSYVIPANGVECWRSALPCADRPLDDVALRQPSRGIAGGFMPRR